MAKYQQLADSYGGFRVPVIRILVDKKEISMDAVHVLSAEVDISAGEEAGGCEIEISAPYSPEQSAYDISGLKAFQVNKPLEVRLGYGSSTKTVFYGKIDSVNLSFTADAGAGPRMTVTGIDAKGSLMKASEEEAKNHQSTKQVVDDILGACVSDGIALKTDVGSIMNFETPLIETNQTDYEFLCSLSRLTLMNFFVSKGVIYFKDMLTRSDSCITLEWGKSLMSFSQNVDMSNQITKVVVDGQNPDTHEAVKGEGTTVLMAGSGKWAGKLYNTLKPVETVSEALATNEDLAKKIANNLLTWRAMDFVTCNGRCIGLPEIEAGKWMTISGLDPSVDSCYFIQSVRHEFGEDGYLTSFVLKGAMMPA